MRFKQKWQGRNCNKNAEEWFPASVPGNIQYDYGVFHKFEDVQYADNYKQYLPLEEDHWEYRKSSYDADLPLNVPAQAETQDTLNEFFWEIAQ